jgi:hypothetical protein
VARTGIESSSVWSAHGARQPSQRPVETVRATLNTRWIPVICGLASFGFVWWMWGSLNQVAPVHDEAAYILQARIFASGHLVAPARPAPEFFEQYHTFVEPVIAAKYPPGFSLLMVPGVWFGLVGLIPTLLVGLSAALAFVMARELVNWPVALMTVVLMNTGNLRFTSMASLSYNNERRRANVF